MRTSYSRRELYALGEPLGDSATYLKADGGYILGDGGGGGGSSQPSNTTSQSTQTQDLPDWAKPYAQDVLSKGKAVTDINQNPYQPYGGQRIAGFTDLQQQAQQGAANMQPSQQLGMGTGMATGAGIGGMSIAGQANPYGFQNQVGGYMNPYMNQILAPQLAEANRNYDIGATKQQSAATQAGAFGGSREAIMAAENERNRNTGLNQIYGQGLNTAYTNAQNQYNQNLQNQLAGYGLMGQSASTLGQLGQNQYTQNMGINALQNQYGGQQQALQQQGLDTAYNDFLTQKNYPYQQLSYMANLVRGTPMGMNQTSQVYQAPPSTAQNLGALGLGAYGLSKLAAKDGGLMDSYAYGGAVKRYNGDYDSVTSEDNVKSIANFLPKEQVPKSLQMAQQRHDLNAQLALQKQMEENKQLAESASIDRGLGGAFNTLPPQMQDGVIHAAGGGILAFANGGIKHYDGEDGSVVTSSNSEDGEGTQTGTRIADPILQRDINKRVMGISDTLLNRKGYTVKPGDRGRYENEYVTSMTQDLGQDPYAPMNAYYDKRLAGLEGMTGKMQAAAAFKAIPLILQGGNAARGIGAAAGSLGASAADIEQAQQVAQDHMMQAKMNIASLQRNEKLGLRKEARADYASLQNNLIAADKNDILGTTNAGNMLANLAKANRVSGGAGGAGKPNPTIYQIEAYAAEEKRLNSNLTDTEAKANAIARLNRETKLGTAGIEAKQLEAWDKELATKKNLSPTRWKKFVDDQFAGDEAAAERDFRQRKINNLPTNMYTFQRESGGGGGGGGGGSTPPPLPPGFVRP
jgi:hypothetical protein